MDITPFQSYVLAFVGQEAIAHAAEIFATLTAAYTFATGFKKITSSTGFWLYVLFLTVFLTGGVYAFLRVYYYGLLSNVVLNFNYYAPSNVVIPRPPNLLQYCPKTIPTITSLSDYWTCVTNATKATNWLVGVLGIGSGVPSISISWALGSLCALAVASYLAEISLTEKIGRFAPKNFEMNFNRMPPLFKIIFWWALFCYESTVTISYAFSIMIPSELGLLLPDYWGLRDYFFLLMSLGLSLVLAIACYRTRWRWSWKRKANLLLLAFPIVASVNSLIYLRLILWIIGG